MYFTRTSDFVIALALFGICVSAFSPYHINSVFALEIGAEVKTKIGTENNTTSQNQASVEEKSDVSMRSESGKSKMESSYQKTALDSKNSFVINTRQHLYNPGDNVQIEGSIWSNLISEIGGVDSIRIQVVDNKGVTVYDDVIQVNNDGSYSTNFELSADSQKGAYTIKSNIDVSADVLNTLTTDARSNLQTSSKFVVANGEAFVVKAEGKSFNVNIASNSNIDNFEFKQDQKKITFTVEGESGTNGVTKITVPKAMLSGELTVIIDGKIAPKDDVIISSDTEAETSLEINYHHSMHTIDITGSTAVPEFPQSFIIVMAVGLISAAVFSRTRFLHTLKS